MPGRPSIGIELREGARLLDEAGIPNSKREANAIWASLFGMRLADVWLVRETEAPRSNVLRFKEALRRRAGGEPLPYVVGGAGFRELTLKVDRRVLIPRPETEGLVDAVLRWCRSRKPGFSTGWGIAVDVGTGSGNIALSLAVEGEFERIVATDSSIDALNVARDNRESVVAGTAVEFINCSLLDPIRDAVADVIVSNPPYLSTAEYAELDTSVADFEPQDALLSGVDGMQHTEALLEGSVSRLRTGGLLAIEVDSTRAETVLALSEELGWHEARIEDDLFGRPRYFLATKEM